MKDRVRTLSLLATAAAAVASATPAAAITTISFSGSTAAHSVTGFIRYDETAAPSSVQSFTGYQVAQYFVPGDLFYYSSDGRSATTSYRGSVLDAAAGNTGGFVDLFGAFVVQGGSGIEQFGFNIDYPSATALTGVGRPALLPQGPATFTYSFAGSSYAIPVTWTVQAGSLPEPAAWALMIGGIGLIGTTLRTRARREGALA